MWRGTNLGALLLKPVRNVSEPLRANGRSLSNAYDSIAPAQFVSTDTHDTHTPTVSQTNFTRNTHFLRVTSMPGDTQALTASGVGEAPAKGGSDTGSTDSASCSASGSSSLLPQLDKLHSDLAPFAETSRGSCPQSMSDVTSKLTSSTEQTLPHTLTLINWLVGTTKCKKGFVEDTGVPLLWEAGSWMYLRGRPR